MAKRKYAESSFHESDYVPPDASRVAIAREDERRKIGRELHDAFGQDLVTVLLEIDQLVRHCRYLDPESRLSKAVCSTLDHVSARIGQIATSIGKVSRQLHPTVLERLGLHAAIRQLCGELSASGKIQVHFTGLELREKVPSPISLGLYRITQEALHNIDKHAHASRVVVTLGERERSIMLRIQDDGIGYDPNRLEANIGLGLASMQERAISLGGEFDLRTAIGKGTEIEVKIPIHSRN